MKQHESADNSQGQLYIVPTPIGNLSDITQRALEVLQAVDLIAAEDTRHTGLLLQHFAINARLFALHAKRIFAWCRCRVPVRPSPP